MVAESTLHNQGTLRREGSRKALAPSIERTMERGTDGSAAIGDLVGEVSVVIVVW
jgi:hypothetical protein